MANEENIEKHQFKKGESGNPKGRPKGALGRAALMRKWLEINEKVKNPITGENEILQQQDIITLALIKKARSGDVAAARELLDGAFGKSLQQMDVTTDGDKLDNRFFVEVVQPKEDDEE